MESFIDWDDFSKVLWNLGLVVMSGWVMEMEQNGRETDRVELKLGIEHKRAKASRKSASTMLSRPRTSRQ